MKLLITGGAGYIGTTLTQYLLNAGHSVRCYDRLLFGVDPLLPFFRNPHYELVKGDIRNEVALDKALTDIDAVIHLAAIVGYPACDRDPREAIEINTRGTALLNHLRDDIPVVFASTGSVYGKLENLCNEGSTPKPLTVYGQSKLEAERILLQSGNAVVYRFATAFGLSPRMRLDLLPNDFTYQAVHQKYLVVYEGQFRRTFIHVYDIARALLHAVNNFSVMNGQVYNCGSNLLNATKVDLANLIKQHVDYNLHFTPNGHDPDQRDYEVDYSKLNKTNFDVTLGLNDGIEEMARAFQFLEIHNPYSNVG